MTPEAWLASLSPLVRSAITDRLAWRDARSIQCLALPPIVAGDDVVLIAPTAGGKTEAVAIPLLDRICREGTRGTSVLWVAPLRALVENIAARLEGLAAATGRRAAAWHGDTGATDRRRLLAEPPELLVTTPEALEAMFLTRTTEAGSTQAPESTRAGGRLVAQRTIEALGLPRTLAAVVVDEVHVLAGTARGGQLLALLRRLGRPVQRIGLSATVGDPTVVLDWLADTSTRPRRVVSAPVAPRRRRAGVVQVAATEVPTEVANLATGRRVLVFCPTRTAAEELNVALRARGVASWPHHAGLSRALRAEAERAFAAPAAQLAGSAGVALVCTSTLELGVDLPNVDRVVQVGAPPSAASLVQRMGRSGRRTGQVPELAIVTTSEPEAAQARALLARARAGDIETPPLNERHPRLLRQQLAARVYAGEHDATALRNALATLPGLRAFTPAEHEAALHELVSAGHLRHHAGRLVPGDTPLPFSALCSVFDEPPMRPVHDPSGALVGETRATAGERVLLGGDWWVV